MKSKVLLIMTPANGLISCKKIEDEIKSDPDFTQEL